jgi:Domain of unknown function (DUF4440)
VHDFNPGITPNGVFWIVQIPDDAVQITGDTLTIHLQNIAVNDQLHFPGGTGNAPATVSFDITYTKSGMPRRVRPTSSDPLSPFTWAGKMWMATNTGTFSAAYNDGSFAATGSFSSSGNFGEMGTERNGSFAAENKDDDVVAKLLRLEQGQTGVGVSQLVGNKNADETVIVDHDTAVVVGTDTVRGKEKGTAYTVVYRYTVTYVRRNGQWLALAEHIVEVPQAK